jgi:inner membrane protein
MMRNSAIARLIVMGVLTIALLIPLMWVYALITERATRRDSAVVDVSATWGGPQVIAGPIMTVPYTYSFVDSGGRQQRGTSTVSLLPRDLRVNGTLATETRQRGIFDVIVYRANLKIGGVFLRPDLDWIRPVPDRIEWEQATVQIGVSDSRGLTRRAALTWGKETLPLVGGARDVGLVRTGVRSVIPSLENVALGTEIPFEVTLDVNGTRELRFLAAAEETTVALAAPWPHPSFVGAALPETRQVSDGGFNASWRVQDFGRPYAARWSSYDANNDKLAEQAALSTFGVALVQPIDIYQQADRAVKYAVLFIVLTFMVFFLWEVFSAALLHPMQYAFVGFALCVFYLLLLSLSEHVGFDPAYGVSATVTTLLIAGYARAVLGGTRQGASVLAALATLYGFLYLLLRLEDYALLAGSVGLFVVLAFVMFITRRMNWYELRLGADTPAAPKG